MSTQTNSETVVFNDPPVPPPLPIVSYSDLLNMANVIHFNEEQDKIQLNVLKTMDEIDVRNRVVIWATSGFPDSYVLYAFQLCRSERCSDGVVRNDVLDYYTFLFPEHPLSTLLSVLQHRLPDMTLSYSYTDTYKICIHISKRV